jgi:hypothetical protein
LFSLLGCYKAYGGLKPTYRDYFWVTSSRVELSKKKKKKKKKKNCLNLEVISDM